MDGWKDGWTEQSRRVEWINGWVGRWMNERMVAWVDVGEKIGRWMDGWSDVRRYLSA